MLLIWIDVAELASLEVAPFTFPPGMCEIIFPGVQQQCVSICFNLTLKCISMLFQFTFLFL